MLDVYTFQKLLEYDQADRNNHQKRRIEQEKKYHFSAQQRKEQPGKMVFASAGNIPQNLSAPKIPNIGIGGMVDDKLMAQHLSVRRPFDIQEKRVFLKALDLMDTLMISFISPFAAAMVLLRS